MAIEDILNRIQTDAQQSAQLMINDAKQQSASIIAQAQEKAEQTKQGLLEKVQQRAAEEKRQILAIATLELRKQLLREKQQQVETAFVNAFEYLRDLEDDEYRVFMKRLLLDAVHMQSAVDSRQATTRGQSQGLPLHQVHMQSANGSRQDTNWSEIVDSGVQSILGTTTLTIIPVGSKRQQIIEEIVRDANAQTNGSLAISEDVRAGSGGFILQYGKKEMNYSLEAMFRQIKEEIVHDVACILFQEKRND